MLPENAEKLALAVARLRGPQEPVAASPHDPVLRIERRAVLLAKQISKLSRSEPPGPVRMRLGSVLIAARERLQRLELEFGPLV